MVEKKGFSDLIEACAHLANRGIDFRCRIVGTGELEADLQAQIEQLGLSDRVELVGPQPQAEVARELSQAAVFAAPCVIGEDGNRDGLPTVLLEAMAVGHALHLHAVTGIRSAVHPHRPAHSCRNHARRRCRCYRETPTRPRATVRLARNARQVIEERCDITPQRRPHPPVVRGGAPVE